jgi:pyruvate dehydrogenase E2 component (dihydrolipoamide acetyltransferase)
MSEGTVVRWLKAPGDFVRRGEPLVEIETDKATLTYEADVEGILTHFTVGEGQTVPVGTPIAYIEPQAAPQEQQPQQPAQPASFPPPLPVPGPPPPLPMPPLEQPYQPPAPQPAPPPVQQPAQPPVEQPTYAQEPVYAEQTGEYEVFDDSGLQPQQPPAPHQVTEEFPVDDQFGQTGDYANTGEYAQSGELSQTDEFEQAQSPHEIFTQEADEFGGASESQERIKASPIARRLARKLGVNVATIAGTGPGGRVVKEDVEAAADAAALAHSTPSAPTQSPAPQPPPGEVYDPSQHDDEFATSLPATGALALPPEEEQILPPSFQEHEQPAYEQPLPPPPAQEPALIPNFPPPPMPQQPVYPQQPSYPPAQYPPQQYPPQQQPFPGPPPFVQGMTGNFPAIQPQQPQQPYPPQPQQPMPPPQTYQPQPQQPVQPPPAQPGAAETATRGHSTSVDPTSAQQTVARRMAESKATAPEFFVETEVDMTTCVAFREQLRSMVTPLPSFNDFVIKSAAQALRQYPNVNAAYKDGHFEQYSDVNIGIVVSGNDLLAVPTLFNVDQKGLAQISSESQQLSESVRSRTIQASQMSGGTFSISNLGMYGVDRFTAILNPPQAAILAVGAINRRAVIAEDGMSLVIRQIMNMTLTCDHRILYGAEAAEFLGAIKAWLESPQLLQV